MRIESVIDLLIRVIALFASGWAIGWITGRLILRAPQHFPPRMLLWIPLLFVAAVVLAHTEAHS